MTNLNFVVNTNPNVKYTKKNPDTGEVKVTREVYDKQNDEILENILHQTVIKKK